MYLKTLTMRGFKSFASATKIELEPGITCVVGPNGSGKSNVVDALAWVMGEQGAKNLRGGKMDDVIFAGTANRQGLGRAEVTLTIDNTDGAIPIDYTEVIISRTLFKSGGSEYAVNGAPARLLDIQELLNDSGLGKEMHVIVGQGRLDAILHADPMERRSFIEEAAGVLKHRRRKDKALRKLTGLQTNLDRLQDLRQELARQLGPLGRQAKAAQRAATVQAVLRDTSARLLADDVVRTQAELSNHARPEDQHEQRTRIEAELARHKEQIAQAEQRLTHFSARASELTEQLRAASALAGRAKALSDRAADRKEFLTQAPAANQRGEDPEALIARADRYAAEAEAAKEIAEVRESELAHLTQVRDDTQAELEEARSELARQRAAIAARMKARAGLESNRSVAESKLAAAKERLAKITAADTELPDQIKAAQAELAAAQEAAGQLETGETELDSAYEIAAQATQAAQARVTELETEHSQLATEAAQTTARLEALKMATALAASTRDIMESGVDGITAPLADLLTIEPGCERMVTAVLGELAAAIVVDSVDAAARVLDAVTSDLDLVIAPEHNPEHIGANGTAANGTHDGSGSSVVGNATASSPAMTTAQKLLGQTAQPVRELVSTSNRGLETLLNSLLADVLTAPETQTAAQWAIAHPELTFVTADGDVFTTHRVRRTGGAEAARQASRAAYHDAQKHAAHLSERTAEVDAQLADARAALAAAQAAESTALDALHESDAKIVASGEAVSQAAARVEALTARAQRSETQAAEARQAIAQAEEQLAAADQALDDRGEDTDTEPDTSAVDELTSQQAELGEQLVEARVAVRAAAERVKFLIDRAAGLRRQAEQERRAREEAAAAAARRARRAQLAGQIVELADTLREHAAQVETQTEDALTSLNAEKTAVETELAGHNQARDDAAAALNKLTAEEHAAELARERFVLQLEELARRARGEIGLSLESLVEQFGPHLPVPIVDGEETTEAPYVRDDVQKRFDQAQRDIKRIGKVNPLALEEYTALQERHDYLEKQIDDVESSRKDLLGLVKEVDEHVRTVFAEAFADTQKEFESIFSRLFPGGEGALTLTDPDDMLTTGVEVTARPAGKRVKRLSLLSGGERSLVAVAMLVAIFKARPSPFYVMDEVEAALDDLNLSRLLTVFQELQESSQLIVITHQKRTMDIADALYGVTMREDGVSRVISQRLKREADEDARV